MPKQKQHIETKAMSLNNTPAGKDSWYVRRMDALLDCGFSKEVEKVNDREDKIIKLYGRHFTRLWWVISIALGVVITLCFPKYITIASLLTFSNFVGPFAKAIKAKGS